MILTDGVHLISDTSVEELHEFASRAGLSRLWFQNHRRPHYDLTTYRAQQRVVASGARLVTTRELLAALRQSREGNRRKS